MFMKIFQMKQWQFASHYGTRLRNYESKESMLLLNMARFIQVNYIRGDT